MTLVSRTLYKQSQLFKCFHCTMRLSMKIKETKILKSKNSFYAHFWTKTGDFFLKRWKTTNILPQIFFQVKNVIFFVDFGQKTGIAGPIIFKLSTKWNQVLLKKNLENENFMRTAVHCENWYFKKTNIFHYFPSKNLKYSQIFLSETIHAQENGSRGPHFAKSLNSNFLKGLTYSALVL